MNIEIFQSMYSILALQRDQKLINDMYKTKLMLMGLRGENIKTATS